MAPFARAAGGALTDGGVVALGASRSAALTFDRELVVSWLTVATPAASRAPSNGGPPPRPGGVPPRDGEAEGASVMRVIGPA